MTSLPLTPLCLLSDQTACRRLWKIYHWKSSSQSEGESCTLPNNRWRLAMLDLRTQLQLLRVTLRGWFLSLVVKMICSSLSETVFICNPKCGANFLPNKHRMAAAHAHEVQTMKAAAIQRHIHLSTILRLIVHSYSRCCPGTSCFKQQFYSQGLSF